MQFRQLSELSFKMGVYQIGDPTGIQLAATALVLFVRNLGPLYHRNICALFRAHYCENGTQNRTVSNAQRNVVVLVQQLLRFSQAITDLQQRCVEESDVQSRSSGVFPANHPNAIFLKEMTVGTLLSRAMVV